MNTNKEGIIKGWEKKSRKDRETINIKLTNNP